MSVNVLYVTHHRRQKVFARAGAWARELARRGHAVTLICIANHERWRLMESWHEGVRYIETPDLLPGQLRSGWDAWNMLRRMLWLRGASYDIVHAFETRPATIYPVLRILRRCPARLAIDWNDWWGRGGLIEERRPSWYHTIFGGIETWFEEHFRPRADHTTVISTALAERAAGLGIPPDRITVISGGVDPGVFRNQECQAHRSRFGLPADRFIALFAAADGVMDLDLVLETLAAARKPVPELLLVMTGHRPAGFDQRVQDAGVTHHVRHLGYLPYGDLPDALSCADVFLLPFTDSVANRGRWPHKIGDYMACGRPTVSNPVGDIRPLFEQESVGILADPHPAAMSAALAKLRSDAALRQQLGARARQVAETRFAWPGVVDRVEAVYSRLMATRCPAADTPRRAGPHRPD